MKKNQISNHFILIGSGPLKSTLPNDSLPVSAPFALSTIDPRELDKPFMWFYTLQGMFPL